MNASIKELENIDRKTKEGRLLFAALAKISTESQKDKNPSEVLDQINELADNMDAHMIERGILKNQNS